MRISDWSSDVCSSDLDKVAIERFVYATTFVTNLIIERATAKVGLITTEGFRDVLELGRASRKPHTCVINWPPAPPLVPRTLAQTVRERVRPSGDVLKPLEEDGGRALQKGERSVRERVGHCLNR